MNSVVAAGMESDYSGSDCDLVMSDDPPRSYSKSKRKPELEFVPISKPSDMPNHRPINPQVDKNCPSQHEVRNQKRHNGHYNKSRNSKCQERRPVVCNSQPLDDLRFAVVHDNLDEVKSIFSKGICVDTVLKSGWTALMFASSAGHPDIVNYLLESKADPNFHKDMFTSLMAVCASPSSDEDSLLMCLQHLLKFGATVNVHERHLTTPLMFAARAGHIKLVKALLEAGASINETDNRLHTALSWAASEGHGIIVRCLLSHGADPTIVNISGQTPADIAHHNGHTEVAAVLERWIQQKGDMPLDVDDNEQSKVLTKAQKDLLKGVVSNSQPPAEKHFTKQGELELFLTGIGLSDAIPVFKSHCLELSDVLVMNDEELEKIGVNQMGARKRILDASKAAHKKEWAKTSLPNLSQQQYISCPDAVAMMANIAKHLKYISSSVVYVRTQIQSQPRILEIAQETASVHDLLDETIDTMKNVKILTDELKTLQLHLAKVHANAEYLPGDLITEPNSSRSALKRTLFYSLVAISCTVIWWKKPVITLGDVTSFIKSHVSFCFKCDTWEPKCVDVFS